MRCSMSNDRYQQLKDEILQIRSEMTNLHVQINNLTIFEESIEKNRQVISEKLCEFNIRNNFLKDLFGELVCVYTGRLKTTEKIIKGKDVQS